MGRRLWLPVSERISLRAHRAARLPGGKCECSDLDDRRRCGSSCCSSRAHGGICEGSGRCLRGTVQRFAVAHGRDHASIRERASEASEFSAVEGSTEPGKHDDSAIEADVCCLRSVEDGIGESDSRLALRLQHESRKGHADALPAQPVHGTVGVSSHFRSNHDRHRGSRMDGCPASHFLRAGVMGEKLRNSDPLECRRGRRGTG